MLNMSPATDGEQRIDPTKEWWEVSTFPQPCNEASDASLRHVEQRASTPSSFPPQPMQRPEHLDPSLRSQPWHDPQEFPWCQDLERNFEAIRTEMLGTLSSQEAWPMVRGQVGLTDGVGEWRELVMLGPGSERGRALCPQTAALLDAIPAAKHLADSVGACGNAIFAKLTPGTRLKPHSGPTNTRLTCHLGVEVPEKCAIRVGTKVCTWEEGKCLVFDDSWEHEVWNKSELLRVVLLVNFWHPDLPSDKWTETAEELRDGFLDY
ncbi:unnamed protein product [Polarella glacialis]|uniref:Aspartyl/asparaginy/proline hydroxylase domain-containing protein n=1 Tax=Polarella glacialis TaxID=89957 RepID=A0A813KIV8_POLGL|nr:unnamed protein product [Polarella glacialis]